MSSVNIAENLALIAQMKSGMRSFESFRAGRLADITDETIARLKREIIAEKRRHLELFKSGKITFHESSGPGRQIDTTPEAIASIEAEIALLQSD